MGDNETWNCCQKLLAIEVLPNCMCSNRIKELKSTSRRRAMMHSKLADSCHLQYKVSNHASSVAKFHFSGSSASLFHSTATVRNYRQLIIVKFYKFDSSRKKNQCIGLYMSMPACSWHFHVRIYLIIQMLLQASNSNWIQWIIIRSALHWHNSDTSFG